MIPRALIGPVMAVARGPARPPIEARLVREAVDAVAPRSALREPLARDLARRVVEELAAFLSEPDDPLLGIMGEMRRAVFSSPIVALATDPDIDTLALFIDARVQALRDRCGAARTSREGRACTARGINLNRDYAKADAPETRAMIALLRRLDPILYVDCHASDGFEMGYDITFTYAGWGRYARHRATADWLEARFGPAAVGALEEAGHHPTIYPSPIDTRTPLKGIRYSPEGPRYSTGYGDFIGVPTVLVENHMLKPYRQRVLGTYVLLEAALRIAAADAGRIAAAKLADRASRPLELLTRWTPADRPIGWIGKFKGVVFDTYRSPASGRMEQRWLGKPVSWRMPIIG